MSRFPHGVNINHVCRVLQDMEGVTKEHLTDLASAPYSRYAVDKFRTRIYFGEAMSLRAWIGEGFEWSQLPLRYLKWGVIYDRLHRRSEDV